ncbi:MAG: hypothetical protein EAZ55_01135 [Cytophagales bacterium]|nr:MAG: hypothetical protein EAZ55_01135 [Cytophagales bacterium]
MNVAIKIGEQVISLSAIWCHYQEIPKPGGYTFEMEVFIDEFYASTLLKKYHIDIYNPENYQNFIKEYTSYRNIIEMTVNIYESQMKKKIWITEDIQWVFNRITECFVINDVLYVRGVASEFNQKLF